MTHRRALHTTLAISIWITLGWGTAATAADSEAVAGAELSTTPPSEAPLDAPPLADPEALPEPPAELGPIYEVTPQLTPPRDECHEAWYEALGAPTEEIRDWREKLNHGIYRIGIGETLLARVELLSTASPSSCDVDPDWTKRQTQILITFFLTDGSTQEVLYEFVEDDVYYDRAPDFFAAGGIVVLNGTQLDGTNVQITLELELLRELWEQAVGTETEVEEPRLLADRAPAGPSALA